MNSYIPFGLDKVWSASIASFMRSKIAALPKKTGVDENSGTLFHNGSPPSPQPTPPRPALSTERQRELLRHLETRYISGSSSRDHVEAQAGDIFHVCPSTPPRHNHGPVGSSMLTPPSRDLKVFPIMTPDHTVRDSSSRVAMERLERYKELDFEDEIFIPKFPTRYPFGSFHTENGLSE